MKNKHEPVNTAVQLNNNKKKVKNMQKKYLKNLHKLYTHIIII